MAASGWQRISNIFGGRDTQSTQQWFLKVAKTLPNTHYERKEMSNPHQEQPGMGVCYWEEESQRKSPKGPDFKGFVVLEMDYKAGEKLKLALWQKPTSRGYNLLAVKEDNWLKKKKLEEGRPQEVKPGYAKRRDDSEDVPF
jgi:hypothetical protein